MPNINLPNACLNLPSRQSKAPLSSLFGLRSTSTSVGVCIKSRILSLALRITTASLACLAIGWLPQANAPAAAAAVGGGRPLTKSDAPGAQRPCSTCTQALGLENFRAFVGGEITPVIIELAEPSGLSRQMAAEATGRTLSFEDLTSHAAALHAKQDALIASLPGHGVRALLRENKVGQVDGSVRHIQYRLSYLLNGFVAFVARQDLPRLRALPEVRRVFELQPVRLLLNTAIDYSLGMETNIPDRRLAVYGPTLEFSPPGTSGHPETPETSAIDGFEGQGMIIAIIDSGVDWRHPMFGGTGLTTPVPRASGQTNSINDNQKVIYYYALSSPGNPTDDFGHGTLVTSCAAGYKVDGNTPPNPGYGAGQDGTGIGPTPGGVQLHGMAPQARVMEYKVCGPADACAGDVELAIEDAASPYTLVGSTTSGTVSNTFIPKPVADVINMSLGDTTGDPTSSTSVMANNAVLAGTIVVAAAGNSGPGANTIGSPGAATLTIAPAASLDPGSISTADLLATNQVTDNRSTLGGPPPETGAASTANLPQPGGRQNISLYPAAGGGPVPGGSVSALYVFVDESPGNVVPLSVSNRIALVNIASPSTFAQDANQLAPLHPAAIVLITDTQAATALQVVNGIPTFTISTDDANYLLSANVFGGTNSPPANGDISALPLRVSASASLANFQPGIAGFSSRGPLGNANARYRVIKPDVTAPGVNILGAATPTGLPDSTIGLADPSGYVRASGTSFATPITSGTMALIRQRLRALSLDSTNISAVHYRSTRFDTVTIARALLMNSASNLRSGYGVPEGDGANSSAAINDFGAGHINVDGALHNNAIMYAPTWLLNDTNLTEFNAPTNDPPPASDFNSQGDLKVYIPSASFGPVPIVGVNGTLVLTQEVVIRDVTSGGGSGTYALSYQNNRNADQPGFQIQFVSLQGTPITSVTVPSGGQASFAVQVTANGNVITNDPTEFQWFVTATPTIATQSMRIPFYYRAVSPTLQNVVAPVQGPILADNPGAGGACGLDTNSSYTVQWSYTIPNGGPAPAGFRIQEATRSTNIFFDDASEALIASGNSKWTGGNDWSSQIDPNSTNLEYYVPDTAMQNSSLVMNTNLPVPPGGASLSFFTSQDLEETFDFAFVEVSTDNGNSFTTVGSYTYDFIGTRHIDLSQFAGQSIKVRFRITSDTLNGQQDPAPTGWYIGNIAIASDDFHTIAEPGPTSTSMLVFGRSNGSYIYRIAGLFDIGPGTAPGPYSGSQCVTETIGVPLIVSIATLTNKHVLLDCRGQALVSHRIQGAADLHIWSNLGTNTASSNGTFQFEDTNTAGVGHRFYRLVTP